MLCLSQGFSPWAGRAVWRNQVTLAAGQAAARRTLSRRRCRRRCRAAGTRVDRIAETAKRPGCGTDHRFSWSVRLSPGRNARQTTKNDRLPHPGGVQLAVHAIHLHGKARTEMELECRARDPILGWRPRADVVESLGLNGIGRAASADEAEGQALSRYTQRHTGHGSQSGEKRISAHEESSRQLHAAHRKIARRGMSGLSGKAA